VSAPDILLATILVAALVVGFFWGAMRSVLLLAAWLIAFLLGAHLKLGFGSYLSTQWGAFDPRFNDMAAFGIIYVGLLLIAPVVIYVGTRSGLSLSRSQTLDDLAGALLAFVAVLLGIAGTMVVLDLYYGDPEAAGRGGPAWTATLHEALQASAIGGAIEERLIPLLCIALRLLVPPDVREAMG
jgi:uncharacterized membrane protein required for colicin V production